MVMGFNIPGSKYTIAVALDSQLKTKQGLTFNG